MKKILVILLCAWLVTFAALAEETQMHIQLSDETILVNGETISEDTQEAVCLAYRTEIHDDVPEELADLSNRVITITDGGVYRFSGSASDAQIAVRAGDEDEVRIILDGVDISCRTAPAIIIYTAKDPRIPDDYAVTVELADGSENMISGFHTEETEENDIKFSGAITSLVSIGFEGEGALEVNGDNEGIETKFGHMTFNGGNITVTSGDDPVNASEDEVAVITVNDGYLELHVKPDKGGEGDGMDSNGTIVINGGTLVSYAHPDSADSAIDSDLGCTINGGCVMGAGNMYDEITRDSSQLFMVLQFAEKVNEKIVVTDTDGTPVMTANLAAEGDGYSCFVLSSPVLQEVDYHVYLGGKLIDADGKTEYVPGVQLQHGGAFGGKGRRGGFRPGIKDEMKHPDEMPEGFDFPGEREFPEDMQPPQGAFSPDEVPGGGNPGKNNGSAEASAVFQLSAENNMFAGISAVE